MNPIYKFELTANGTTQRAFPIYKDDLAKEYEKESGQEFFRAKLSGKLTFESDDYTFIVSQAFDTQFVLEIFISYNAGQSWTSYWRGTFWKTDCVFNVDDETVTVGPEVLDQYNAVLAGLDKEFNLIDLAPEIVPVKADKRPMVQVYVPGQTVISCFLSGMWWEQECEAVEETDTAEIEVDGQMVTVNKLTNYLHFALNKSAVIANVSGTMTPELPNVIAGTVASGKFNPRVLGSQDFRSGDWILRYYYEYGDPVLISWQIVRAVDNLILWHWDSNVDADATIPKTITLTPVNGATGNVTLYIYETPIYCRYICDVDSVGGVATSPIPYDDLVPNNRNYRRVVAYSSPELISISTRLSVTPTEWGIYQPGQYYLQPASFIDYEFFPISRNSWGRVSFWWQFSPFDFISEPEGRKAFTINNTYPLYSVISVLLGQIATGITHAGSTAYSEFLYGSSAFDFGKTLTITPKSNVLSAGYDQPAQKAPITLRNVLDMLRDCFRCFWFIDEQNRFRIEHILYFEKGGSYSGVPVVGIDLTELTVSRNGKQWAFGRNEFRFDKPEMAARYQFGWMDDVTQLFEGYPFDILANYVDKEKIEQITVAKFTSDIDYILLNPSEISRDGFVLLAPLYRPGHPQRTVDLAAQSVRNYNINPTNGKWGTNSGYKHIRVAVEAGDTIRLTANSNNVARIAWLTSNSAATSGGDVPYVPGTSLISQSAGSTREYIVPGDGTVYMYIYWGSSASNPAYLPSSMVVFELPDEYKLPYLNYVIGINDHYLQNGYLAFVYLQRYYDYDMPAPNYSINGLQITAQGVKKLRKQSITFQMLEDVDLVKLVKTGLGEGAIEKLSINLCNRNANATLAYDTE